MDVVIFAEYGIEILRRGHRLYIRYDAGEIAVQLREIEITEAEAERARESEQGAYEVILSVEGRTKLLDTD